MATECIPSNIASRDIVSKYEHEPDMVRNPQFRAYVYFLAAVIVEGLLLFIVTTKPFLEVEQPLVYCNYDSHRSICQGIKFVNYIDTY
jgi:hypothetical protein